MKHLPCGVLTRPGSAGTIRGPNSTRAGPLSGLTAPHDEMRHGERPIPPDDDPSYRAPDGYEDAEPGTVLRSRDVEIGFLGLISQPVKAVQLLYRTTHLHEEPEVAVTTVLVPAQCEPDIANPMLSYQCAIVNARSTPWRRVVSPRSPCDAAHDRSARSLRRSTYW